MTSPEAGSLRTPASGLPDRYLPRVAGYARGPFIDARLVTPTDFRWRNARTYVAEDADGVEWRVVRVTTTGHHHFGWWAVERLGIPLPLTEWGHEPLPELEPELGELVELADGRTIRLPYGWKEVTP